jgi:uncharacterized damage-inducible protein DinB
MVDDHVSELADTWRIHARICTYVLDATDDDALYAPSLKGRTAGAQWGHIHAVRLMWLKSAQPDLVEGLPRFEKGDVPDKTALRGALVASGEAVEQLVMRGVEAGRVKGFKPHPTAFVAYLISHESSHQGDIGVRLTESGHPLPKPVSYGMWEWGVR